MTRSRRGPSLVALVAVVATACAGLLAGCAARPADTSLSRTTLSPASLAAVRSLLDARAHAVRDRDEQAWRATLEDPQATTSALVAEFALLSALPWAGFDYADVRPTGGGADLGVTVTCVSRLTGERADTRTEEHFTLVRRASGWRIAGHRATPTLSAPWWSAGARATRGQHAVVVGAIDADTATWYAHQADAAVEAAASVGQHQRGGSGGSERPDAVHDGRDPASLVEVGAPGEDRGDAVARRPNDHDATAMALDRRREEARKRVELAAGERRPDLVDARLPTRSQHQADVDPVDPEALAQSRSGVLCAGGR